jgi:hypothetical protein
MRCASVVSMSGWASATLTFIFFARKSASLQTVLDLAVDLAFGSSSTTATLKSFRLFLRQGGRASFQAPASIESGPAIAVSAMSRSSALRAIGPTTAMSDPDSTPGRAWPRPAQMSMVGLWP